VVRHAFAFGLATFVAGASGCGNVDSSSGGVNAPCTRDYDCASGLTCLSGVCTGPLEDADAPADTGVESGADAGGDG
jgi:hypothetical protein